MEKERAVGLALLEWKKNHPGIKAKELNNFEMFAWEVLWNYTIPTNVWEMYDREVKDEMRNL